jgi:glycerol-3-phosphate O-acyltransferase
MFADTEVIGVSALGEGRSSVRRAGPGAFYTVPPEKRLSLDTSKNVLLHFFVERALVALALLAAPEPEPEVAWVSERVRALSRLFKFEFRFRADQPFEAIFANTVRGMVEAEEIDDAGGRLRPGKGRGGLGGPEWLDSYAAMLASLLEGYRVAARALGHLDKGRMQEKDLVRKALALGREMLAAGVIDRPEAVSKPVIQNAFQAFIDHGFVASREGYELSPAAQREGALASLEVTLASYLPRDSS